MIAAGFLNAFFISLWSWSKGQQVYVQLLSVICIFFIFLQVTKCLGRFLWESNKKTLIEVKDKFYQR